MAMLSPTTTSGPTTARSAPGARLTPASRARPPRPGRSGAGGGGARPAVERRRLKAGAAVAPATAVPTSEMGVRLAGTSDVDCTPIRYASAVEAAANWKQNCAGSVTMVCWPTARLSGAMAGSSGIVAGAAGIPPTVTWTVTFRAGRQSYAGTVTLRSVPVAALTAGAGP